jgi:mannitol 2-dehydrogenase
MRAIYGDLSDDPAFVAAFGQALHLVWNEGVAAALARYTEG